MANQVFLDTGFAIARFNRRDQYHAVAIELLGRLQDYDAVVTTEAVLLEIAAAFSQPPQRRVAIRIWDQFHHGMDRFLCVSATGSLMDEAMNLYRARQDKSWTLTDCLSFIIMVVHLPPLILGDRQILVDLPSPSPLPWYSAARASRVRDS